MLIAISGYSFLGPFTDTSQLNDQSGVYVILGKNNNQETQVIDVGESENIRARVGGHDRRHCWEQHGYQAVAVYYIDENSRMNIEKKIRNEHRPPCGQR